MNFSIGNDYRKSLAESIVEHIDAIVYPVRANEAGSEGVVNLTGDYMTSVLGYDPEEFRSDPGLWLRSVHPDDLSALEQLTADVYSNRQPRLCTYRMRHKATGEYLWMEDKRIPWLDADGKMVGVFGIALDITGRVESDRALQRREAFLKTLFETSSAAIFVSDRQRRILRANPRAESMFGFPPEQLIGRSLDTLILRRFLAADIERGDTDSRNPQTQPPGKVTLGFALRQDGREFPVEVLLYPIAVESAEPLTVSVIRDMSRSDSADNEQADKFSTARKMEVAAGQFAHDFNNLLMVINGHSHLILRRMAPDDPMRDALTEIHDCGRRAQSMTQQLLAIGR